MGNNTCADPGGISGEKWRKNMKRYRFKYAIISGLHYRTAKLYLRETKRFMIIGYEKIYY